MYHSHTNRLLPFTAYASTPSLDNCELLKARADKYVGSHQSLMVQAVVYEQRGEKDKQKFYLKSAERALSSAVQWATIYSAFCKK